jgi:hypothetical protein
VRLWPRPTEVIYSACLAARSGSRSTQEPIRSPARNACSGRPAPMRPPPPRPSASCSPSHPRPGPRQYLEVADLEVSTREAHQGYIRRTIGPVLGEVKIRKLGADSLDALYTAPEEVLAAMPAAPSDRALRGRRARLRRPVRPAARPPHHPPARLRQPLPPARVPADEARHDPARPLDHLLGPGPGRPLRLGGPQRRQERQPAALAQARAGPAQP